MDLLTEIVDQLRTKGQIYGCLDLTGPFAFRFPVEVGHFLVVLRGSCFLLVKDVPSVPLTAGDFVFLPTYRPFSIGSSTDDSSARPFSPAEAAEYLSTERITYRGGEESGVVLLTGCFSFAAPGSHMLIEHLPAVLQLPRTDYSPEDQSIIQLIAHEIEHRSLGSKVVIDRLAEVLFVHTLRYYADGRCQEGVPSWIRALRDPQIGVALQKIHDDPGHPWTVEELAKAVAMSRSGFAAKFRAEVGTTPLEHLTRWRMARAAGLLGQARSPKLETIAATVGYESESSFRKAFQKTMGVSPSGYRGRLAQEA